MNQNSESGQNISVGGNFNIDAANSVVNLRDIIGQVTNTINQLPSSSKPEEPDIKELLSQLKTAIEDPNLSDDDKQQALQQVQTLAEAAQNPKNEAMQKKAKKAIGFLKVISEGLEPVVKLVQAGKDLIPAIATWFGL